MTIENEQITPADAAIVSSGTGTKGPEERDLPASLKALTYVTGYRKFDVP